VLGRPIKEPVIPGGEGQEPGLVTVEKHRLVRDVKVGMLADLVLLSDNIFAVPSEELAGVRVAMTVVDGRVVYER